MTHQSPGEGSNIFRSTVRYDSDLGTPSFQLVDCYAISPLGAGQIPSLMGWASARQRHLHPSIRDRPPGSLPRSAPHFQSQHIFSSRHQRSGIGPDRLGQMMWGGSPRLRTLVPHRPPSGVIHSSRPDYGTPTRVVHYDLRTLEPPLSDYGTPTKRLSTGLWTPHSNNRI